ncbi:Rtt102p KNAG_0K00240 [Huiozyma naganishii CBS 8797]|uniref:Uncharacterized protein n=1 Tax=Huiozyma naganishii (strain ATCC MYA-139 / BCRC 22969 / CBS 8797 / KCTC 17520 / NBRC 10181 / NCYC 3082 / Yp74L-3) TaxID=1071383 RepID=J7S331_HUIN7|nr:hypothetical protein KNAG_0K00240 [Kazachstania naganishii CBS 8797]CCK72392.1 hypothetical protein KNAG_0K00240 [Kazachstania naganishii CBS 8797]
MDSLIKKANQGGRFGSSEHIQHWQYVWHTPTRDEEAAGRTSELDAGATAAKGNNQSQGDSLDQPESFPFKFKTWKRADECEWDTVEDTLVPLDLDNFDITKVVQDQSAVKGGHEKETQSMDGLTEDDIRGAVGGSESIPGLSGSSAPNTEVKAVSTTAETPNVDTPKGYSSEESPGESPEKFAAVATATTTPGLESNADEEMDTLTPASTLAGETKRTPALSNQTTTPMKT